MIMWRDFLATLALGTCTVAVGATGIPDQFDVKSLDDPQAVRDVAQCIGEATPSAETAKFVESQRIPVAPTAHAEYGLPQSAAVAVASRSRWACISLSKNGFPMWPVESLSGGILPMGAPAPDVAQWRRSLLEGVAERGTAQGLVAYTNGNATLVTLTAEPRRAGLLKFTIKFMKPGEFKAEDFRAVISHPSITGLLTESTGGSNAPSRFVIPPARLRKAVDGDYVALPASSTTAAHAFENTQWKATNSATRLWLQPEGLAIFSTSNSSDNGTWKIEAGVLRVAMANGSRMAFTLQPDGTSLRGEGRRVNKPRHAEDDGEWHWSLALQRQ